MYRHEKLTRTHAPRHLVMAQAVALLLGTITVIAPAFAEPVAPADIQAAAERYEVPTFKSTSLDISGQDLFRYGDDKVLGINLGSDFRHLDQTPMTTLEATNNLQVDYGGGEDARGHAVTEKVAVTYQRFFGSSHGFNIQVGADVLLSSSGGDDQDAASGLFAGGLGGAGFGRILDARTVAQAAAMCEVAQQTCSADKLVQISEVLSKASAGYYAAAHKFEADVYFYRDLTKAVGSNDAFALRQVLTSPLYRIGSRRVGMEAGARMLVTSGDHIAENDGEEATRDVAAQQYFGWASLLDASTSLSVTETLIHGMKNEAAEDHGVEGHPGEKNNVLRVEARLNIDHSYQWGTEAVATFNMLIPEEGDATSNYSVLLATNRAIGSDTLLGADFVVGNGDGAVGLTDELAELGLGDEELHWQVTANFRHFIF